MPRHLALTMLLIGHRGTGKTSLLDGLLRLEDGLRGLDLDREIEHLNGATIADIIASCGLEAFRSLERQTLEYLVEASGVDVIAVGAGFPGPVPGDASCVWVRRATDADGRVLHDRPRLDMSVEPLAEYQARFSEREDRYARLSDRVVTVPEGLDLSRDDAPHEPARAVCDYVLGRLDGIQATITLLPEGVDSPSRMRGTLARLLALGANVELRDDLLSDAFIAAALQMAPSDRLLYSARRIGASVPAGVERFDWDMTLGEPPAAPMVLSLHPPCVCGPNELAEAGAQLEEAGSRLPTSHQKLAVVVRSFAALDAGHEWAAADPVMRSFLPISPDGRWAWYRLLRRGRPGIHYVREGHGSAPDQPTVLQWSLAPEAEATVDGEQADQAGDGFVAFLGDPCHHSRTPIEHQSFFSERNQTVVAIRITKAEWPEAMPVLDGLGLVAAAVSAPLKRLALDWCNVQGPDAKALGSVNTLHRRGGDWLGNNTDAVGLEHALRALPLNVSEVPVAVWGGGGMLGVLKQVLPAANFFSARTGECQSGTPVGSPDLVVYASGGRGMSLPDRWHPGWVLDLDYRENSPGRAYAFRIGAHYVSGVAMFEAQAAAQRRLWSRS